MEFILPKEETAFDALRAGQIEESIRLWKKVQEESGHCNTALCHNTDHERTCCVNHFHGRLLTLSLSQIGTDHFELAKALANWIRAQETKASPPRPEKQPHFELSDSLIIGHPTIDHDHRFLAQSINDISRALWNKDYHDSKRRIYDFLDQMQNHLEKEIQVLEQVYYPDIESHNRIHDQLKDRTQELKEMADRLETSEIDRERVFPELVSFFLDDAIKADLGIKTFLEQQGLYIK